MPIAGRTYIGDVGFNTAEEIDFIPAGHFANPAAPILDFGWTDREGTVETVAPYAGESVNEISAIVARRIAFLSSGVEMS